jgi:regulator of sirC expression with transglutaminase-like and TPR domain
LALLFNQLKRYKEAADELELFLKIQPDVKDTDLIKKPIRRFRERNGGDKIAINTTLLKIFFYESRFKPDRV